MRLETTNTTDLFNRACERLVAIDERRAADDAAYEAQWLLDEERERSWFSKFFNRKPSPVRKPPAEPYTYPSLYAWGTKHRLERLFALFSYEISNFDPNRTIHLDDEDLDALGM